jgi:S1-C subfamily serine protease
MRCSHATRLIQGIFLRLAIASTVVGIAPTGIACFGAAAAESSVPDPTSGPAENAVVKVFATVRYPDLSKPWTKQAATEITGSGVVIRGRRILTNAHLVLYAGQIQIRANQAADKVSATVEAVAPGVDLAVLKLDDETFFDSHRPLPVASGLPNLKDSVMVYGYPTGGTDLSITKGIISRIDFASYNFPTAGLRIQIDAPLNAGNSGGPAIVDDKMVGIAFARLTSPAENIGYIVPSEEIELFLRDIADGRYDGKPGMHDDFQTLENKACAHPSDWTHRSKGLW